MCRWVRAQARNKPYSPTRNDDSLYFPIDLRTLKAKNLQPPAVYQKIRRATPSGIPWRKVLYAALEEAERITAARPSWRREFTARGTAGLYSPKPARVRIKHGKGINTRREPYHDSALRSQ